MPMFTNKEALILVLELAEQAALQTTNIEVENDEILTKIARDQANAILVVYENILGTLQPPLVDDYIPR